VSRVEEGDVGHRGAGFPEQGFEIRG